MSKKYISPTITVESIDAADVILASNGYRVMALEGVDTGDDKSAVFNVNRWFH